MKKYRKIVVIILAVFLIIGGVFLAKYLKSVQIYRDKVAALTISYIDIDSVADGIYIGDYDVDFIYAKVRVEVKNGEIISIDLLEHENDQGGSAEKIVGVMLAEQKIKVDAISGATNSSKVIQKAVEKALTNGSME